ncbi:MAG: type IV pilus assembly protein PilM [Luteolibacter sp.]
MAETQTSVALNIGSQRISMAVFETSKTGGLILKSYASEAISADPSQEASRIVQTRAAITELAKKLKIGKTKIRYAISGQSVFTRFVKLPPLQEDNIEQLVTFEAQQHVPFPIDEVVWDYELIEGAGEKEAVIVAIKGESLDEINDAVNAAGLGTSEVDVAPMALYNAFRSAYGQVEEPVLVIDIGAKTSNLLYIEGGRFFTRSIPIGGSAITAAIAKEYQISFADAEAQKVTNGLVLMGGGHAEQLDESIAGLGTVIRNALTRLPAEIARTTNYFRSQHGGSAPRRVILAGGGANLPYTLEFFAEKLNLPIEYFNPIANVTLGKSVEAGAVQGEAHQLGELIGLGLRGIGKSAINIDLVPDVVEQSRAADRRKPFLIGAAALVLLGCGAWAGLQFVAAKNAEEKAVAREDAKGILQPLEQEISAFLKKEESARKIATGYTSAEADHAYWLDLLAEVRGAFASDAVWITDFSPVVGFEAVPAEGKTARDPRAANGRDAVRPDFPTTVYGASALADIRPETTSKTAKGAKPAEAPAPVINAIRVKGLWRENPKSQNVVSECLKNLKDKTDGNFTFKAKGPKNTEVTLNDEQILKTSVVGSAEGALANTFEITLPLSRPVPAK